MAYQNYSGVWLPETVQGDNHINGSGTNQTFYGSGGGNVWGITGSADTLVGGGADDFYWLPNAGFQVVEGAGGGTDTVQIWQAYKLPANVENVILFGDSQYAAGNAQDNIIQNIGTNNQLYGGTGQDVLVGNPSAADTFIVVAGEGNKAIQNFSPGQDHLRLIGGDLTTFATVRAAMTQQGSDVALNDGGTMIVLRNTTIGQFQPQDFQLPLDRSKLGGLTFNDDFNSLQLVDESKGTGPGWRTNFGYAGDGLGSFTLPRNGEQQIYANPQLKGSTDQPLGLNPFSVNDGVLTISANPVSPDIQSKIWGYQYTSGLLTTDWSFAQTYGYFEMRAELPKGQGLWPAFWLASKDGQNKEIDIMESLGSDRQVDNTAFHSPAQPGIGSLAFVPQDGGFHTYGMLWTPQTLTWYLDGTEVWQAPTPPDMNVPMQIDVNLAVGGNWAGSPDGTTPWPGQMNIDYIRAYALADGSSSTSGPQTAPPPPEPPAPPSQPASQPPPPPTDTSTQQGSASDTADQVLTAVLYGTTLTGGSGSDILTGGQGGGRMTGGGGADTFVFKTVPWTPTHISDFQPGVDRIDVSALFMDGYGGSNPVRDGYVSLIDDGAGGTALLVDPDGPASGHPWPDYIADLEGVSPAALIAANVLGSGGGAGGGGGAGNEPNQVLTATTYGTTLVGGAGDDVLTGGQGGDRMTGGGGADTFVFRTVPWTPTHITDFQPGVDRIDVTSLYVDGYRGSDPIADGYVRIDADGAGGTEILVDLDGRGSGHPWPDYVLDLEGVSPDRLQGTNWLVT